jgi:hypothetical protein
LEHEGVLMAPPQSLVIIDELDVFYFRNAGLAILAGANAETIMPVVEVVMFTLRR